jgi:hypothetical protein
MVREFVVTHGSHDLAHRAAVVIADQCEGEGEQAEAA